MIARPWLNYTTITEANSMDIHRLETYHILLESWEGAEHCPIDRIGIGHLVVEESGIESESTRKGLSLYC